MSFLGKANTQEYGGSSVSPGFSVPLYSSAVVSWTFQPLQQLKTPLHFPRHIRVRQ